MANIEVERALKFDKLRKIFRVCTVGFLRPPYMVMINLEWFIISLGGPRLIYEH